MMVSQHVIAAVEMMATRNDGDIVARIAAVEMMASPPRPGRLTTPELDGILAESWTAAQVRPPPRRPIEGIIIITRTSHYESFTVSGTGCDDSTALDRRRAGPDDRWASFSILHSQSSFPHG